MFSTILGLLLRFFFFLISYCPFLEVSLGILQEKQIYKGGLLWEEVIQRVIQMEQDSPLALATQAVAVEETMPQKNKVRQGSSLTGASFKIKNIEARPLR